MEQKRPTELAALHAYCDDLEEQVSGADAIADYATARALRQTIADQRHTLDAMMDARHEREQRIGALESEVAELRAEAWRSDTTIASLRKQAMNDAGTIARNDLEIGVAKHTRDDEIARLTHALYRLQRDPAAEPNDPPLIDALNVMHERLVEEYGPHGFRYWIWRMVDPYPIAAHDEAGAPATTVEVHIDPNTCNGLSEMREDWAKPDADRRRAERISTRRCTARRVPDPDVPGATMIQLQPDTQPDAPASAYGKGFDS